MFDSKHYIPILKWKRAEQSALTLLDLKQKEHMTPLVQFVMPKLTPKEAFGKSTDQQFEAVISKFQNKSKEAAEEILEAWGKSPIFIDISLLYTTVLKVETFNIILSAGKEKKMFLIPVLHLSDGKEVVNSIKKSEHGVCLRLVCNDLDDFALLENKIKDFLTSVDLIEKNVDLLVDIKEISQDAGKFSKYFNLSKKIPNLLKWRTFTFASGAFHEDLSKCKIDEVNLIPRFDWKNWVAKCEDKDLVRIPSFGDYTIQYPVYKESTQFFAPTTSIKYALEDDWFILKGEKQKFELYLVNAKLLVEDERFYDEAFSAGDKFIVEKANHFDAYMKNPEIKGTGGTENWLSAGINHHLALVAHQVSSLLGKK
jgi:hypothetical protein